MSAFVNEFMEQASRRNAGQPEFLQAVKAAEADKAARCLLVIDDAANEDADYASSNLKADEAVSRTYIVPVAGICPENRWCKNSAHAADHAAAGSFG